MNGRRTHRWYFWPGILLLAAAVLLGGLLLWLTVTEYRPEPVEPAVSGDFQPEQILEDRRLRILSFNTGYGSLGEDADFFMDGGRGSGIADRETVERNLAGIAEILQENPADLYLLQEVDRNSSRTSGVNHMELFGGLLPDWGWHYAPNFRCRFVPYPFPRPFGRMDSGVATYSRYAVEEASRISLPVPFAWPVRTANLKRCMLETRLPLEDSRAQLVVLNVHLEAYSSGEGKQAQARQLLQTMVREYEKGNYVLAGGDFNQIFPQVDTLVKPTSQWVPGNLDPLPEDMAGWSYVCDASVPSCRLLNQPHDPEDPLTQYYTIDGFLLSPNLEAEQIRTLDGGFRFSDHNPVVLDVVLR